MKRALGVSFVLAMATLGCGSPGVSNEVRNACQDFLAELSNGEPKERVVVATMGGSLGRNPSSFREFVWDDNFGAFNSLARNLRSVAQDDLAETAFGVETSFGEERTKFVNTRSAERWIRSIRAFSTVVVDLGARCEEVL